jgi:hypothetical protein
VYVCMYVGECMCVCVRACVYGNYAPECIYVFICMVYIFLLHNVYTLTKEVHTYMHVYICIYMYAYIHTCMHAHIYVHNVAIQFLQSSIKKCIDSSIHTCMHAYIDT